MVVRYDGYDYCYIAVREYRFIEISEHRAPVRKQSPVEDSHIIELLLRSMVLSRCSALFPDQMVAPFLMQYREELSNVSSSFTKSNAAIMIWSSSVSARNNPPPISGLNNGISCPTASFLFSLDLLQYFAVFHWITTSLVIHLFISPSCIKKHGAISVLVISFISFLIWIEVLG